MKRLLQLFACLLVIAHYATAQQAYKISEKSTTSVLGTSTLHDWESKVEVISGNASVKVEGNALEEIQSLNATFKAKSIKSGKSRMDNITYDAIKADDHPNITFQLSRFEANDNGKVTGYGTLTIAGKSNEVAVEGTASQQDGAWIIEGSHPIKLTNYGIDPPTAMLGAIKVGDDLTIKFHLELIQ